jgi:hypothetical protein
LADDPELERRRLAAMLPGAELGLGEPGEFVALVDDVDRPIPVLVERGRYAYDVDENAARGERRVLRRPPWVLTLVRERREWEARTRASGSSGWSAS